MTLDPSIPFRAGQAATVNLADMYAQAQNMQMQRQAMQQRDRQMDMQERQFEFEMQQSIAKLDAQQREAAKEGVKDLAGAVQWANSPERWAVVQQHYAQYDPQLASISFEQREQALVRLGQMGEYLEQTAPKIMGIEAGGSLAAVDPRTGQPKFTVLPNPGNATPGAPAAAGGVQEGATATNPQTGERLIYRGGTWQPMGGGAGNSVGTFQP